MTNDEVEHRLKVFPNVVSVVSSLNSQIVLHFVPVSMMTYQEAMSALTNLHSVNGNTSPLQGDSLMENGSLSIFALSTLYISPAKSVSKEGKSNADNEKSQEGYSLYAFPLHKPTLQAYLPDGPTASLEIATNSGKINPHNSQKWSCMSILPDHLHHPTYARLHALTRTAGTSTSRPTSASSIGTTPTNGLASMGPLTTNQQQNLKKKLSKPFLVMITDDKPPAPTSSTASTSDTATVTTTSSSSTASTAPATPSLSIYLLQIQAPSSTMSRLLNALPSTESDSKDIADNQTQNMEQIRTRIRHQYDEEDELFQTIWTRDIPPLQNTAGSNSMTAPAASTSNTTVVGSSSAGGGGKNHSSSASSNILMTTPRTARPTTAAVHTVANSANSSAKKWYLDTSVLSSVCQWRSCLCMSSPTENASAEKEKDEYLLCSYHQEMKYFLDYQWHHAQPSMSSSQESMKYLPKKSMKIPSANMLMNESSASGGPSSSANGLKIHFPTLKKLDFLHFRAASTLLQELWDKRLKTTLKQFISKSTATQCSLLVCMEQCFPLFQAYYSSTHPLLMIPYATKNATDGNNHTNASGGGGNMSPVKSAIRVGGGNAGGGTTKKYALSLQYPTWHIYKPASNSHNSKSSTHTIDAQALSTIQAQVITLLQQIHSFEECINQTELPAFVQIHYFPYQEILHLKKEMKAFKERQELYLQQQQGQGEGQGSNSSSSLPSSTSSSNAEEMYHQLHTLLIEEVKLMSKKFSLLQQRRVYEEEHYVQQQRKLAKLKAIEERQAQDPAHFSHQSNRFS
jgi:hypothetical protein